jgi:hypothetical protein
VLRRVASRSHSGEKGRGGKRAGASILLELFDLPLPYSAIL